MTASRTRAYNGLSLQQQQQQQQPQRPFKTWKANMIESKGDYRDEAFLEDYIGGPLYEYQHKMPKLVVPSIQETLERFLPTATPLAKTDEERMALIQACKAFPEQALQLQQRLLARQKEFKDSSWLQLWWNQLGYLAVRDPLVVNVSYFFSFTDDPTIMDATAAGGSLPNVQRAATLLYATAEFRKQVCSGHQPREQIGKKKIPICSTAYKYMFNACRIPHRGQDTYRIYDPSRYTHCIVARKGFFFTMELVDPDSGGDPLPIMVLEDQLRQCIRLADAVSSTRPKLGLMTSQDRDDWADAREALLQAGGLAMEEALQVLESGAVLLNLDDEAPVSRQECGDLFWTGGLTSGGNRWFDKSIQIMVANNGKAGVIMEHSMMDGMPIIVFADYITKMTYAEAKRRSLNPTVRTNVRGVTDIFGNVFNSIDPSIPRELETKAWNAFHKLITDHVLHAQSFQGYGSSYMKKSGFAPDAFVQMAMQLATFRLFGEQAGTYEATQVRSFHHGRTEATRTVSTASEAFVKKMGSRPKMDEGDAHLRKEKLALLKEATHSHARYAGKAGAGRGVERHFFGLSMLVKDGESPPTLYSNPVFARSKRWRVSTSQLTHPRFNLWGYGEVVPDGVGLAYAVLPRSCVFNITALRETGWTDKLSELLEEALLEMRTLIEMDKAPSSKL